MIDRRLYRSEQDKMLFGVAGGLADYFDADVSLVRLGWVVMCVLTAGVGVLAYLAMGVVTPTNFQVYGVEEDGDDPAAATTATSSARPVVSRRRRRHPRRTRHSGAERTVKIHVANVIASSAPPTARRPSSRRWTWAWWTGRPDLLRSPEPHPCANVRLLRVTVLVAVIGVVQKGPPPTARQPW